MSLVVATWNLQWQFGDWEARQRAIAATLTELDPDIVMVQESWRGQVGRLAAASGRHFVWAGHEQDPTDPERGMGNAIMSRWPIESSESRFLEDDQGRKYRTIVFASVATPWGSWPLFTTHLEHRFDRSATRVGQLGVASTFIEEHVATVASRGPLLPPVLAGDLNAVSDSDEVRKLTGRSVPYVDGRIWTDAWEQVGSGPGITWSIENPYIEHTAWPNRRLDYVFIGWPRPDRPVGNPVRAWLFGQDPIDGLVGSDHYGVAVEIHT